MFGSDFYPTPKEVIESMLAYSSIGNKIILEPSAGKGDIVDFLKTSGAREVIACEINNDLSKILSSKCRIICDDFLKLKAEDISHIDMIVMNPPFSADEDHILHAFEIAPGGCEIISLCNENTVSRYSNKKQEAIRELIELYGYKESLGHCFDTAERKTNVYVSMVRLFKPSNGEQEFEGYFSMQEEEENPDSGILLYNEIQDIVSRYVGSVKLFDNTIKASKEINEMSSIFSYCPISFGAHYTNGKNLYNSITRDVYKKELQKAAWKLVFSKLNMNKYVTRSVKSDLNLFIEKQQHIPFTMHNIFRMLEMIVSTHEQRMNKILVDAFEKICSYSSMNSTAGEKWKTNSDYMINKRFIIPNITNYESWYSQCKYHVKLSYSASEMLDDIVKALCLITGANYANATDIKHFFRINQIEWGKWAYWSFFKVRGYKKGTMHFEFQNDETWMLFNRKVAEIKGWRLPKSTKKDYRAKSDTVDLFN